MEIKKWGKLVGENNLASESDYHLQGSESGNLNVLVTVGDENFTMTDSVDTTIYWYWFSPTTLNQHILATEVVLIFYTFYLVIKMALGYEFYLLNASVFLMESED